MSDYGDFCREQRQRRQAMRREWHECPHCAVRFGTGTKVPPGGTCHHDGWQAPGKRGDDKRAVNKASDDAEWRAIEAEQKRRRKQAMRTCRQCGKAFKSEGARKNHEKDKHPDEELPRFDKVIAQQNLDVDVPF